mmetsp:Transcript_144688/g.360641  ORF Transcript_144688/g.360641 Transcript_144688/m.360641 type:complete len:333 (-) Transcript_144688:493-1491(-)
MQRVVRAPLDIADDHFQQAVRLCEEVSVPDGEAGLRRDRGVRVRGVAVDGVEVPGVDGLAIDADMPVRGAEHIQYVRRGDRRIRLVDEPGHGPRAREVRLPADNVDVFHALLQARLHVLHREGPVPRDADHLASEALVVEPHLDSVVDSPTEFFLARVDHGPWEAKRPRPHANAREVGLEGRPCLVLLPLVLVPARIGAPQLMRHGASSLLRPSLELDGIDAELVVAVVVPHAAHDLHRRDVALQLEVRQEAVVLAADLEVFQDLVPARPELPIHRWTPALFHALPGPLVTVPNVVRGELGLQLRSLVRHLQPRVPARPVVSVEHDIVVVAL